MKWHLIAASFGLLLCLGAAQPANGREADNSMFLRSARLAALDKQLRSGDAGALDSFWGEVKRLGTPLVEPISGDDKHVLVTFLWRGGGETKSVVVFSPVTPAGHPCCSSYSAEQLAHSELARLPGTDVWFKTIRLRSDLRFTYYLSPNDSLVPDPQRRDKDYDTQQADPLNPRRVVLSHPERDYVASLAMLPAALPFPFPWLESQPNVPKGRAEEHRLPSKILGSERRFSVYTPPGYAPRGKAFDLLVLLDGSLYWTMLHAQTIIENLLAGDRIRPLVIVLVESQDGFLELSCNVSFNEFLARELIPWVREHYNVTRDPTETTVGGFGLDGLAAAFAGLRHPEIFGNVLSQSGTFSWDPKEKQTADKDELEFEWIIRQYAEGSKLPLRFVLTVGALEYERGYPVPGYPEYPAAPSLLQVNRHMRDVLVAKGYTVRYIEVPSGKEIFSTVVYALPDSLLFLAGNGQEGK